MSTHEDVWTASITVGQPYPTPSTVATPSAGWHAGAGNMVLVVDPGLTPERAAVEYRGARLWLAATGPLLILVMQLANGDQLEMPAVRLAGRPIPSWAQTEQPDPSQRLAFTIVSVDHTTGIVTGFKVATVSPHLTQALVREVRDRWATEITVDEYRQAIEDMHDRFPSLQDVIRAAIASSRLGD